MPFDRARSLTLLLLMLLAVAAVPLGADDRPCRPSLAGTWTVQVSCTTDYPANDPYFGLTQTLKYLQDFTVDGRTTLLLPDGFVEPKDTRTGCMGEWQVRRSSPASTFDMTLNCLYSSEAAPALWDVGLIRSVVKVHPSGRKWTAKFRYDDYDKDGNYLWGCNGQMVGTRLEIQPLP
jgi:hypothetical protein